MYVVVYFNARLCVHAYYVQIGFNFVMYLNYYIFFYFLTH